MNKKQKLKNKKYFTKHLIIGLMFLSMFLPLKAAAFEFNPNNIITDFELKDKNSMSQNAIQAFLNKYDSVLKDRSFNVDGTQKTAAEIIYQAAQKHFISPKFILTKLDHEQCLIRGCSFLKDPIKLQKALDWATGFGVCTNCNLNSPKIQKYKGFANQVDALASVQNDYIRKADKPHIYSKGQTFITSDGYTITPENQATANLYTYTPYRGGDGKIGGNYFFAKLWEKYWGEQLYPDGTVLKDSQNHYWLIDAGTRRRYSSLGIYLSSHAPEDAITVSAAVLDEYEVGPEIKFANYSLVRDENDTIYLLVDGRKRKIQDQETFRQLGFNPEEVQEVNSHEIADYKNTVPITKTAIYPQGALLQDQKNSRLYWVQNGFRHLVYKEIADLNYSNIKPIVVGKSEIDQYYPAEPQKIKDGKLVKSKQGDIYMVSHGRLRPIASQADFVSLFGENKWSLVRELSNDALALHKISDPIEAPSYERDELAAVSDKDQRNQISYKALWVSAKVPLTFIAGKSYNSQLDFKNKNGEIWEKNSVYLKLENHDSQAPNQDIVLPGAVSNFNLPIILNNTGDVTLTFKLYAKDGTYVPGGFYQTKAQVIDPMRKARILEHNLPIAVKNSWSRVPIEVKIKNQGKEPWIRKATGLKFLSGSGTLSPFYDSNDWLDKELASVSIEPMQEEIAPGQSSIFRFTIKPQGLAPGIYYYRLVLWMKDKNEIIYLNGGEFYNGVIRIDPA